MKMVYWGCALLFLCTRAAAQENPSKTVKKHKGLTVLLEEPTINPYVVQQVSLAGKLKQNQAGPIETKNNKTSVPKSSYYQRIKQNIGSYLTQLYGYLPTLSLS